MRIFRLAFIHSIRTKVALFVFTLVLLMMMVFGLVAIKEQQRYTILETYNQARSTSALSQSAINRMFRHGRAQSIVNVLAELKVNPNISAAFIVDDRGKILYANRKFYVNKQVENVLSGSEVARIQGTIRSELSQFSYIPEHEKYIAYIPVIANSLEDLDHEVYVLMVEHRLASHWYHSVLERKSEILLIMATLLIIGVASWYYIDHLVASRLRQLMDSVGKIALGETVTETGVMGNDEIASVARAIEEMSEERSATEAMLRKLTSAVDQSLDSVVITNCDAEIEYVNDGFVRKTGYSPAEVLGKNPRILQSGNTPSATFQAMWAALSSSKSWSGELWNKTRDGQEFVEQATITPVLNRDGVLENYVAIKKDITEQKALEQARAELSSTLDHFFNLPMNLNLIVNLEGIIIRANAGWEKILGYKVEALQGSQFMQMVHPDDRSKTIREVEKLAQGITTFYFEIRFKRLNDGYRYLAWSAIADLDSKIIYAAASDVTERKNAEERLHQLAYYDALTGLPNKAYYLEMLTEYLSETSEPKKYGVVFIIDIDHFQHVNDARGYEFGDLLLKELARRLSDRKTRGFLLVRASDDMFIGLTRNIYSNRGEASRLAESISENMLTYANEPVTAFDEEIAFTVSVGAAIYPENHETADNVTRHAETALHHVKNRGGNQYFCYQQSIGEQIQREYEIENELRYAISNNELCMYIQHQVDYQQRIKGLEALVRWQHPHKGLLMPGSFIPVAEKSDIIVDLDNFMLTQALAFIARNDVVGNAISISVNISPRHFRKVSFVPWLKEAIAASGADANHLVLEVTEGLTIDDMLETVAKMNELRMLGIRFSIDDFGTGYSSLSYLKQLPVYELKIDKSFIMGLPHDKNSVDLVKTILVVAKSFGLRIVAEGVETQEQADLLYSHMPIVFQGFLYSKPYPVEQFE